MRYGNRRHPNQRQHIIVASKAVSLIKRSVQSGLEVPFSESLAIERELQQQLFQSEDAKEGLTAYNEKRKPNFAGR
jgi:enoyl-CoA hydratase/carnithine racemase